MNSFNNNNTVYHNLIPDDGQKIRIYILNLVVYYFNILYLGSPEK